MIEDVIHHEVQMDKSVYVKTALGIKGSITLSQTSIVFYVSAVQVFL